MNKNDVGLGILIGAMITMLVLLFILVLWQNNLICMRN